MQYRVPINDLKRLEPGLRSAMQEKFASVLASGLFVHGSECAAFEKEFAAYCGVRHCVGVANGTDAIEIGLRAIGVGPDSSVATVANAGFYSSAALNAIGATAVYIDIDPQSLLMDTADLEEAFQSHSIDAVIVTHLYGAMADVERTRRIAEANGALLFEDCAQAHGATRGGVKAGAFGACASFSFYPTKNLGAVGDGGAIVTNSAEVRERATALRQYGWGAKYDVQSGNGRNSRLDEIQAALLRLKLPSLDKWNARRRSIAAAYIDRISNSKIRMADRSGAHDVAHLLVLRADERDALREHLSIRGVASDIHYPIPDHKQAPSSLVARPLPHTERECRAILTIPCFPEMTGAELDQVVDALNAW